ncbi:MAG: class I SAM-dependent methyltransferase [Betaproteobacteria bacterium]|nr:class I SAM-dependent methyltransferase [Betaproteobacteria bacterium]
MPEGQPTYCYNADTRVWSRSNGQSIAYSDGDEHESYLLETMQRAKDVSCFSEELAEAIRDWPSEYHLSRSRHNLLRPFEFSPEHRILELGCGCGAMTRYLGETGARVIAVEGNQRRAAIAAERCRDLPNVSVVCDNLADFTCDDTFDYVTLIGVLEYAPIYIGGDNPVGRCLAYAHSLLRNDGSLLLAIENQLGLKYFNGCGEDHLGKPYYGIHSLYAPCEPVTFGRSALQNKLSATGFVHSEFFFPFPDYKLPNVVLAESAFSQVGFSVADLLSRSGATSHQPRYSPSFHEGLTWQAIVENGLGPELSNSFLVFAKKAPCKHECNWLAKTYTAERMAIFATETSFIPEQEGLQVYKRHLLDSQSDKRVAQLPGAVLHQELDVSTYRPGRLYLIALQESLARGGDLNSLIEWASRWIDSLRPHFEYDFGELLICGEWVDATPGNFVEDHQGNLHLIDAEWRLTHPIPAAWLVVRGTINSIASSPTSPNLAKYSYRHVVSEVLHRNLNLESKSIENALDIANDYENALQMAVFGSKREPFSLNSLYAAPAASLTHITASEQIGTLELEIRRIKSTLSWRITKPIRLIGNMSKFARNLCRSKNSIANPAFK